MEQFNEDWTADVVSRMHKFRITNLQLAEECNYSASYLCTVLNGRKNFENESSKQKTKDNIYEALQRLESKIMDNADD